MDQEFDLLGDPIPPAPERGRPVHEVTPRKIKFVLACVAANWTHEEIAAGIGVSPPTLRKHYFRELQGGKAMVRATLLVKLQEQIDRGNVSAMRLAHQILTKADLEGGARQRAPAPPKRGKREIAKDEALHAHEASDWGNDLAPIPSRVLN